MNLTINVTKKHIRDGKRGKCRSCPVALALRDKLQNRIPGFQWVGVADDIEVKRRGHKREILARFHGWKVSEFILDFDSAGPEAVKPFSFSVRLPKEFLAPVA